MSRVLALFLAVALTSALAGVADAQTAVAPPPADAGVFLVSAYVGKSGHIFSCDLKGQRVKNLTNVETNDHSAVWSPDGKKIAFTSSREATIPHIFVMDADGQNVVQLTRGKIEHANPSWSPDGKRLAYDLRKEEAAEIHLMDLDGKNDVRLDPGLPWASDPVISPDGAKLAFAGRKPGQGFRLYSMGLDGKNVVELSTRDNHNGSVHPVWRPGGKQIAYTDVSRIGGHAIFVLDVETRKARQFSHTGSRCVWSPDGKVLGVLDRYRHAVYLLMFDADGPTQLDGAEPQEAIFQDLTPDSGVSWRPK
jgi:TolB protein